MATVDFEINPNVGLGPITFGTKMEPFIKEFGKPDELENIDEDEEINTTVLHYWDKGLSVFFVGLEDQLLAGIETDHPDSKLFGEKIMNRPEAEIVGLMKEHGHEPFETEAEENDKRLSYEISMMDFFFRDGKLIYMNFGVFVDDKGQIEPVSD
jgi:hypothetical protein